MLTEQQTAKLREAWFSLEYVKNELWMKPDGKKIAMDMTLAIASIEDTLDKWGWGENYE